MNLTVNPTISTQPVQKLAPKVSLSDSGQLKSSDSSSLGQDIVEIRKGIFPSLKGAAGGAIAGGTLAGAGTFAAAKAFGDEYAELAIVMGGGLGALAGGITGAVVANMTDDKSKASMYGALVGGGVGLAVGLATKDLKSAVVWGVLGAGAGVGGAFAGSAVAKRN